MEEQHSEDIEELVQDREEEYGAEESLPQEVEVLLHALQGSSAGTRLEAVHQLGDLSVGSPRLVDALMTAQESDTDSTVRWYAADALRAPVHQQVLGQHPDLMERAQALATEAAAVKRARRET